jgi:hypothetical protein
VRRKSFLCKFNVTIAQNDPEILSGQRHDIVSQLAGNALAEQHRAVASLLEKIEAWDRPYQFIGIAMPPKV